MAQPNKGETMTIKKLQDTAFANALKHGFHHKDQNFGEQLMLIVSELSEALEADRIGKHYKKENETFLSSYVNNTTTESEQVYSSMFKERVKDTVEDELADAVIRIADLAGYLGIDLETHIKAKMRYNETRPEKHGKEY